MPFSVTIHFIQLCQDILQLIGDGQTQMSCILQHGHTFIGQIEENDCGSQNAALAQNVHIQNIGQTNQCENQHLAADATETYRAGQRVPLQRYIHGKGLQCIIVLNEQ